MSVIEYLSGERLRARKREARISRMADTIVVNILDGTGPVGTRMSLSRMTAPKTGEHPLTHELLEAVDYHPLVVRTLQFTQRVLPPEHFLREDGKTPYIRHVERTALFYLDLLPKNMPKDEKAVHVAIMLAHDSEEVPQERYMENLELNKQLPPDKQIDPHERGGLTQGEVKQRFDEAMIGLPRKFERRAKEIYAGIHAFNCNDFSSDVEYLAALQRAGHGPKKIVDRGMDSPLGDMFRIARIIKDTPLESTTREALAEQLTPRYDRLARAITKAEGLRWMSKGMPKALRDLEEFYEATIRAGRAFPIEANKRLEAKFLQVPAAPIQIYPQRGPSE